MSNTDDPQVAALRDFVITEAVHQQAKEAYAAARKTLLNLVPKEIGEHKVKAGEFTLTVKYPEKIKWDAPSLDALYGTDKPAHVKLSYTIDLNVMRRLPLAEQETLKDCYELVVGTPDIDIVKA